MMDTTKPTSAEALRVDVREEGVAVVVLNHPTKPVNTLSPDLVVEFRDRVDPLLDDPEIRALVVASAKKDTFIAGADLEVLTEISADEISRLSTDGNALLSRIAGADKPVVAAVHGAALGGGLEVALACHFILASNDSATVLGLPEVLLGLLPAGGGTQRLVRRVGLLAALPMLLTGRRVRSKKALRMGLVDAVTTPRGIVETAVRTAVGLADGRITRRRRKRSSVDRIVGLPPVRSLVLNRARSEVTKKTRGLYPAPIAILECVESGLKRGEVAGLALEARHFGPLAKGLNGRHQVWIFQAMNAAKKANVDGARNVGRLGVLGAGLMGSGVASVSLGLGPVVVHDVDDGSLARAAKNLDAGLAKQVRSGAIRRTEAHRRWSGLRLTTDIGHLTGSDLLIEAVYEDLELKRQVLSDLEPLLTDQTVIASNTSALPISEIAAALKQPERVLGMHYFSPVPKMPLLEIVVTPVTADWALATARTFAVRQGKTCIVVTDGPGFYTTRILAPMLGEAITLLEEGARVEDVDRAMKDFGYPVGPFALLDEVGIDVGAHVARDLGRAFADRGFADGAAIGRLVEAGYHGRKTSHGFYRYDGARRRGPRPVDPSVYEILGGSDRCPVDTAEIQDRLALLMVNEAAHCLAEGVVASVFDADLGAILGLGFPPFRGGVFHHVDTVGAAAVVQRLEALAERFGPRFAPAPPLVEAAGNGQRFYG